MATSHSTLTANATTNINVGTVATDHGVIINYSLSRDTLYAAGHILVLNKTASVEYDHDWFGDDAGLTVAADIDTGNLRLNMTVDNSDANDITFNYNKTAITL